MSTDYRPLILTAQPEPAAAARLDALRRKYFPPERNQLRAHITLFHALPGSEADAVVRQVQALARGHGPITVEVPGLRSLGGGVALALRSPVLEALRAELAHSFAGVLTAQDAQGFRAHVTIQNKVTAAVARATLAQLTAAFEPWSFEVTGIGIWRYAGGPWEAVKVVALRA